MSHLWASVVKSSSRRSIGLMRSLSDLIALLSVPQGSDLIRSFPTDPYTAVVDARGSQ
jgi:hypothetical protein